MVGKISDQWVRAVSRGEFVPCSVIHDHGCLWNSLKKFVLCFKMGAMFYSGVHLLPILGFK